MNINFFKNYFKKKYQEGYKGYEIVIALFTLVKESVLSCDDIIPILSFIYAGNFIDIYNALNKASIVIDDNLLDEIINEVKKKKNEYF